MLRCTEGLAHILAFMAGAMSTGHSTQSKSVDMRSSAIPQAAFARKSAALQERYRKVLPFLQVQYVLQVDVSEVKKSLSQRDDSSEPQMSLFQQIAAIVLTSLPSHAHLAAPAGSPAAAALYAAMPPDTPSKISRPSTMCSFFTESLESFEDGSANKSSPLRGSSGESRAVHQLPVTLQ